MSAKIANKSCNSQKVASIVTICCTSVTLWLQRFPVQFNMVGQFGTYHGPPGSMALIKGFFIFCNHWLLNGVVKKKKECDQIRRVLQIYMGDFLVLKIKKNSPDTYGGPCTSKSNLQCGLINLFPYIFKHCDSRLIGFHFD